MITPWKFLKNNIYYFAEFSNFTKNKKTNLTIKNNIIKKVKIQYKNIKWKFKYKNGLFGLNFKIENLIDNYI